MRFHLIGNSHLDPVWLWDWREGLNEALSTVRSVLNLMDEDEKLTYVRGESLLYRHIEETEPDTFRRIVDYVAAGRWDVVGGTYNQPDTNLSGTETLVRQFTEGQRYFHQRFGKIVKAAWQADSFGHTSGLPEVLSAAGIESFAFTRPDKKVFPLKEPAFWWEGPGGSRVLAYRPMTGWYGTERDEMTRRLDALLDAARYSELKTVGCFYGLGNHGGGPTRRHLAEIQIWAEMHPEVKVIHSGLHPFFTALRQEIGQKSADSIPTHRGELNFCLRGCYSSMARFKYLYRRGENSLARAERTDSGISAFLGRPGTDLTGPWRDVLFNSFHDILPGSSIEAAVEDQTAWMGQVLHASQKTEFAALNRLAESIDTRVAPHPPHQPSGVSALVWNPHLQPFHGHVELEACLDYRPIFKYSGRPKEIPLRVLDARGKPLPFQEIDTLSRVIVNVPWRKRVLVPVDLPALGWNVIELGWVEDAPVPKISNPVRSGANWIDNGSYRVQATVGRSGVRISYRGSSLLGQEGLTALVYQDPWGSWGGMVEEPESTELKTLREKWTVQEVAILECGGERAKLWVRLAGTSSRIDLTFSLCREREAVDVQARVFWAERGARLKLRFPAGDVATFEVPGDSIQRHPQGEVPGGRWVSIGSKFGFASDALYNFSSRDGAVEATVVRSTRFAEEDRENGSNCESWRPFGDLGEHKFKFVMTSAVAELPRLARELEQPPVVLLVPAKKGKLPRMGSIASLSPDSLQVLALKRAESGKGFVLRIASNAARSVQARLKWMGKTIVLGKVRGGQIASWKLEPNSSGWRAVEVDAAEFPRTKKTAKRP